MAEAAPDWQAMRVLCVDDDQDFRHTISGILRNLGVGSTPMAKGAEDAFYELEASAVDMVIVNRHMKGIDGIEFVRTVRDPQKTMARNIPVIMISGEGSVATVTHAIKQGVDHYMVKPISSKDLGTTIENLIGHPPQQIKTDNYIGPCRRRLPQRVYGPYAGPDRRGEEHAQAV